MTNSRKLVPRKNYSHKFCPKNFQKWHIKLLFWLTKILKFTKINSANFSKITNLRKNFPEKLILRWLIHLRYILPILLHFSEHYRKFWPSEFWTLTLRSPNNFFLADPNPTANPKSAERWVQKLWKGCKFMGRVNLTLCNRAKKQVLPSHLDGLLGMFVEKFKDSYRASFKKKNYGALVQCFF